MALGGNSGWVNVTGGEGKDRQKLDLPGVQQQLLEAVAALGKPVVLVLYGPGIFSVNRADNSVKAILQAFMPGQFAGQAVANVLFGDVNPGGKLTMSVPRSVGQVPIYYNHKTGSGYRSGGDTGTGSSIFSGGYVDGPADPLYCFGHGLSYTEFELTDLAVSNSEVPTDGIVEVECTVKNTGSRAGDEVVQLYTSFFGAHVTRPNIQLCGFKRVTLNSGESKRVKFKLSTAQLGYYNENMEFVVEPGELTISVGNSSNNLPLKQVVTLTGSSVNVMGKRVYTCDVEVN
jgi:beta-glucosidase